MKKTFFKSILCASLFVGALTSCNEVEDLYNPELVREKAKQALGLDIAPNQDWNMTSIVTANITLNEDALSDYSFRIYTANPLDKNSGATILADYPIKTDAQGKASVSFKFEMPSYLKYVYVARVDNHGRRWVGVSSIKNGTLNKTFGANSSASTRTANEFPTMSAPYEESTVNSLEAYTITDSDLNRPLKDIMVANNNSKTIKLIGKSYNQAEGFNLYYDNGGMVSYPNVVTEGTFKFIIGEGATWEIPADKNPQISGIDIIVASGGTLRFSGKIQPTLGARIIVMPGGKIESESTNAYIYADGSTVLIYNAGTINTNIIELSRGGLLYNATTGVIEATTIKTSGGGQQTGWDQTANKPILAEEKIINEGRIKAGEITSNGMQGELYNGCLIRADKISVKQLNLKTPSAIEVPTIECNEYYLRKDCIVRATTLRTVNGSLYVEYIGNNGNALLSVETMDLSGNTVYINDEVFVEASVIKMNGGIVENNNDWIKEQLANNDIEIFKKGGAPITILPSKETTDIAQADCIGDGNIPAPKEDETSNANIYTYAFEDLSKEVGDYDMNDVVLKCSAPINGEITVQLVAAGAMKNLYVYFYDEQKDIRTPLFGGKEVHEALGVEAGLLANTNPQSDVKGKICEQKISVNDGFLFVKHGDFYIVDEQGRESHIPTFDATFTPGLPPYGICVPEDWRYPREYTSVIDAYPAFKDWAGDVTKQNWYTAENSDANNVY